MRKRDRVNEIGNMIMEPLFTSLIDTHIRQNVMPVVCYVLTFIQFNGSTFRKIMSRIPEVLAQIQKSIVIEHNADKDTTEDLQRLVDLIYALKKHFPDTHDRYKDLVSEKLPLKCACQERKFTSAFLFDCLGRFSTKLSDAFCLSASIDVIRI